MNTEYYKKQSKIINENFQAIKEMKEENDVLIRESMRHLLSELGLDGIVSVYDTWNDKTYVGKILINSANEFEFHKLTKKGEVSLNSTFISRLVFTNRWYCNNLDDIIQTLTNCFKPFEPQKDTPEIEK